MSKVRAWQIRSKSDAELLKQLDEMKRELAQLRVSKAAGTGASKLGKICVVRKNIAKILTVYNQKKKMELREKYKNSKRVPKELRPKLTRKIRRALTPAQTNKKTIKMQKKIDNLPVRKYALMA
eukprot:GHVS01010576.1.p1 GENE.GHVS01010576.1~~GHVS01010576.1.p1  ORF type:complete len:124 (+),score=22.76 GHVS01010576.1:71-442(+)